MLGEFNKLAPYKSAEDLTSEDVKEIIHSLVKKPEEDYDSQRVKKALCSLRMPLHIADPSSRVLHFASFFLSALRMLDMPTSTNPSLRSPRSWYVDILDRSNYARWWQSVLNSKNLLKRLSRISWRLYARKQRHVKRMISKECARLKILIINTKWVLRINCDKKRKQFWQETESTGVSVPAPYRKRNTPPHPRLSCLSGESTGPLHCWVQSKKRWNKKREEQVAEPTAPDNSVTFSATFGGKLQDIPCKDIGADANFRAWSGPPCCLLLGSESEKWRVMRRHRMPSKGYSQLRDARPTRLYTHAPPRRVDDYKKWMAEPFLGRPRLLVLGLNTKKILATAADRLHGDIDVGHALQESETGGKISRVLYNGVLHSDQGTDCPSADVEQEWLDFGIDDPTEKRRQWKKCCREHLLPAF